MKRKSNGLAAKIEPLLARIEKHKANIAAERDKLREVISDVEDICDSLTQGDTDLEAGLETMRQGLDRMSELL